VHRSVGVDDQRTGVAADVEHNELGVLARGVVLGVVTVRSAVVVVRVFVASNRLVRVALAHMHQLLSGGGGGEPGTGGDDARARLLTLR
jgi:hypothetical protein